MANWTNLKSSIADAIKTNGNQSITGDTLQQVLISIVNNVGENATFAGVARTNTNPGVPDGNVFYLAVDNGVYSNFGQTNVQEISVIQWNGSSWVFTSLGIPTKTGMRSKSNIAFISCNSQGHIVIEGNTITFDKQGWDIYAENYFFRADGTLDEQLVVTLYNGSGFIYFDMENNKIFSSGNQSDINSKSLLIGLNRLNDVTLFCTKYTDNGAVKGLYNAISANTTFDKNSLSKPTSHRVLFQSFFKNAITVNRGKVSWEKNIVQLGAGSYYFYNPLDGSYKAVTLSDTKTIELSSTNTCLTFDIDTREFQCKPENNISATDITCLFYDGANGVCGGLWYEYESLKKLIDASKSPNGALGLRYTLGLAQVSEQLIYTEMFPATAGDIIKWTSYINKTSISLEELNSNKTVIDRWTAPSNTRTVTLTRSDTAYVRAVFAYTDESSAYDQSLYINNSLKAKLSAEVKNEFAGVAYFCNANVEVDASTRVVTIKQGSDVYAAVKNTSVFYRFATDYSFNLDSGGTNFLLYDYKNHTIVCSENLPTNACAIGVKNGYKVSFNGNVTVKYSDGDIVRQPISANNIKELSGSSLPSFVEDESMATYKRVVDYISDQDVFLLAHITDVHSGGSERYKHVGYLNTLNKTWGFNILCNGGDIGLDTGESESEALSLLYNTKSQMNCTSPWLYCKGNHERNISRKELGTIFIKPSKRQFPNLQIGDSTFLYGYIDDTTTKTRTIFLNTSDTDSLSHYAVSDVQVVWLGNTLYNTPSGYRVIILTHLCPKSIGEWVDYPGDWRTAENLTKIIEAFAQRGTASHAGENWNFAGTTAKIVCVLSGDSHFNNSLKENGVNYFVRQGYGNVGADSLPSGATFDAFNPNSQCLFDVLVVKDNSNAKIFRIGAGGETRDISFTY